jgi:hypothetical protein
MHLFQQDPTSLHQSQQDPKCTNNMNFIQPESSGFINMNDLQQDPTILCKSQQESIGFNQMINLQQDPTSSNKTQQDPEYLSKMNGLQQDQTSLNKPEQDPTGLIKMNPLSRGLKLKCVNEQQETNQAKKSKSDEPAPKDIFKSNRNEAGRNTDKENMNTNIENGNEHVENRSKNKEHGKKSEESRSKNKENRKKSEGHRSKNKENKKKMKESRNKESGEKQNYSGVKGFCLDCDNCEAGCLHLDHSRIVFRDLEVHKRIRSSHSRFQPVNMIFKTA